MGRRLKTLFFDIRGRTAAIGRFDVVVACRGASRPRKKDAKTQLPTRSTHSQPKPRPLVTRRPMRWPVEHHRAGSNGPAYFGGTRNLYAMSCGWPPSAVPQDENKEMVTHVDAAASPLRHGGSNPPGSIFT